jgi:hypothetical protein
MSREEILKLGLVNELKKMANELPNDYEFGHKARKLIEDTEEKLKALKSEKQS